MTDKEKLMGYLKVARADYESSLKIAQKGYFKRWKYKRLGTGKGLSDYFADKFNVCCIVEVHLRYFKPKGSSSLWFPIRTKEGFEARLKVIDEAIAFYNVEEVPLLIEGSLLEHMHLYTAYEQQLIPANPISMFIEEHYDELMDIEQG